ncbi:MAG: DUF4912 domain-containing protein [Candidatus Brocadiaceae bacterium]|nr:DUF4912 domain-containing protein [Candidatus Brocadiaceae bacterium]
MDKDVIKEIVLFLLEIIKALCEMFWKKIKAVVLLLWDRFFGMKDVDSPALSDTDQEWGVTGEDTWPCTTEETYGDRQEIQQKREDDTTSHRIPQTAGLPENYGENQIVLMTRDPLCLFCYWEIQSNTRNAALEDLGAPADTIKTVLRVYDVTDVEFDGNNANMYIDNEITGDARSWYIHLKEPARSFCVDIGLLTSQGIFRTLARSNIIQTPRMEISDVVQEDWKGNEALHNLIYQDWQKVSDRGISGADIFSSSEGFGKNDHSGPDDATLEEKGR